MVNTNTHIKEAMRLRCGDELRSQTRRSMGIWPGVSEDYKTDVGPHRLLREVNQFLYHLKDAFPQIPTMSIPNFNHLEQSAAEVIRILKSFPEFENTKIAIIGGLAVWMYIPWLRTTTVRFATDDSLLSATNAYKDVDFITTAEGAPKTVKQKLLKLPNSPFEDRAGIFVYQIPNGPAVQIDMTPEMEVCLDNVIVSPVPDLANTRCVS